MILACFTIYWRRYWQSYKELLAEVKLSIDNMISQTILSVCSIFLSDHCRQYTLYNILAGSLPKLNFTISKCMLSKQAKDAAEFLSQLYRLLTTSTIQLVWQWMLITIVICLESIHWCIWSWCRPVGDHQSWHFPMDIGHPWWRSHKNLHVTPWIGCTKILDCLQPSLFTSEQFFITLWIQTMLWFLI